MKTTAITPSQRFLSWLAGAPPGETFTYFEGELSAAIADGDAQARTLQRIVWRAAEARLVLLTQLPGARIEGAVRPARRYFYRATRTSVPTASQKRRAS